MPPDPFIATTIPPLAGLEPVPDDDGAAFEKATYTMLVNSALATIVAVATAAQRGEMPLSRALGLIQGSAEHYRSLANLYSVAEPEFEPGEYGGGLTRRVARRFNGLAGQGVPGLTGMLEGQTESANINALTSVLKSDASEEAKAVARERLDKLLVSAQPVAVEDN